MKYHKTVISRWKKPNSLAKPSEVAHHIFAHISEQHKAVMSLNEKVKPIFKEHASMDVSVASYDAGRLSIAVDSLSAANHLNYLNRLFLDILRKLPELTDMTVLSFVYIEEPKPKQCKYTSNLTPIDDDSRKLLKEAASIIRDNPALSHALRQLSERK